jgi:hypothetical protein
MTAKGEELVISLQSQYQQSALPLSLRTALDDGLRTLQAEGQALSWEAAIAYALNPDSELSIEYARAGPSRPADME